MRLAIQPGHFSAYLAHPVGRRRRFVPVRGNQDGGYALGADDQDHKRQQHEVEEYSDHECRA